MYIGFFFVQLITNVAGEKFRNIPQKEPEAAPSLLFPLVIMVMIGIMGFFFLQVDYGPVKSDNDDLYYWIKTNTPGRPFLLFPRKSRTSGYGLIVRLLLI